MYLSPRSVASVALRKTRRSLIPKDTEVDASALLILPEGCELVAKTFIVFKWQEQCCLLQTNLTLYCWGGRRSGALEHVLAKYGWTHSSQLYHINSKAVSLETWSWLQQIFVVVHRMFDEKETGDTVGKIHWLNVVQCDLAYDLLKRECYHYRRNLYPAGSILGTYLKHHGVEVEGWYCSSIEPEEYVSARNITEDSNSIATISEPPSSPHHHEADVSSLSSPSSRSSLSSTVLCDIDMDVDDSAGAIALALPSAALGTYEWLSDVHIANLMFLLLHGQLRAANGTS